MKYQVLIVGDDAELLEVRIKMASSSWDVEVSSANDALRCCRRTQFDLVILCCLLQPHVATGLVDMIRSDFPASRILALHLPGAPPPGIGHDLDVDVASGPSGLQRAGQTLLDRSKGLKSSAQQLFEQ